MQENKTNVTKQFKEKEETRPDRECLSRTADETKPQESGLHDLYLSL